MVQGTHKGRAAVVTHKQNILGLGDPQHPGQFAGRSKVAGRPKPCVKGALGIGHVWVSVVDIKSRVCCLAVLGDHKAT